MSPERTATRRTWRLPWRRSAAVLVIGMALLATMRTAPVSAGGPVQLEGDLFYTKYAGGPRVKKVAFSYDGSAFTLGVPQAVASTPSADGIIFVPDGDLAVGGQGNTVYKVNPTTGTYATVTAGGTASFHLALDPSGTKVWSAGIPGNLAEVPLTPFANGIFRALSGSDTLVTSLAFDNAGNGYYTSSGAGGFGGVGRINLTTFTTTRVMSGVPAAHGMAFDKYTGHLMLFGSDHITQIDPATMAVVADSVFPGLDFDQGTVDGNGHMFVAANSGYLFFMDYKASGSIAAPTNFVSIQYLDSYLDDVAPLAGPGAQVKELQLQVVGGPNHTVGTPATVIVKAIDTGGNGMGSIPITLTVGGANPGTFSGTTAADGTVAFTYTGTNTGDDSLVATGGGLTSNTGAIHWTPACTPTPVLGWQAPLSSSGTFHMPLGSSQDLRFNYTSCGGAIRDESVIMLVADAANPDEIVTIWVFGSDIAYDNASGQYSVRFNSSLYGLAPGRLLKVQAFIGDELRGEALIQMMP